MCALIEPRDDTAARPSMSCVGTGWRILFAKWLRNLALLGYFAILNGCFLSSWAISGVRNPYNTAFRQQVFALLAGVEVSLYGVLVLTAGAIAGAFAARRPCRFSLRRLMVVTAMLAVGVAPAYNAADQAICYPINLRFGWSLNPSDMFSGGATFYVPYSATVSWKITLSLPLLALSLFASAALAALPMAIAEGWRRSFVRLRSHH